MSTMLVSGAALALLIKFMLMQNVPTSIGAAASGFFHPYFLTLLMMVGHCVCLIVYFARPKEQTVILRNMPKNIFVGACALDFTTVTLANFAYSCIPVSVVQMSRGTVVVFTCLLSVLVLGQKQQKHQFAGVGLVALGMALVSASTFLTTPEVGSTLEVASAWTKICGIGLCLASMLCKATLLVYEQNIMSKHSLQPLLVVGMEGTLGIVLYVALLAVRNAMHMENTAEAVYQIQHSPQLMAALVAFISMAACFNVSGVTVTQKSSAVARSTIDVSCGLLMWAVELSLGWTSFHMLQLVGFLILALGTMIYNKLVVLPALGCQESERAPIIGRPSMQPVDLEEPRHHGSSR